MANDNGATAVNPPKVIVACLNSRALCMFTAENAEDAEVERIPEHCIPRMPKIFSAPSASSAVKLSLFGAAHQNNATGANKLQNLELL
jgi:hypothetical protein